MRNFVPMNRFLLSVLFLLSGLPLAAQRSGNRNAEIARNLEIFDDIYKQLDAYYVDTLSADTAIQWAIEGMLSRVDPFTSYFPEDDDDLRQLATGKYAGIGSTIRLSKREQRAVISEPYEGTPSQEVGVKAGDIILTIDGKDVKGLPLTQVTQMLRGEAGTTFELRVRRPGEDKPLSFRITRRNIQLPSVPYYGMQAEGLGYLYLTGFTSGTALEVRRALQDLKSQGMRSLVLDLRGNPGGALDEAVNIVNLFVPKGRRVVYTQGKVPSVNREYYTSSEPLDTVTPMVVLVDGWSASSAEIVSGSLQDMDRAVVMGARTYGKGLVQSIRELPYRGNLKITVSRYYIPSGRCLQAYDYRHLKPDGSVGTVPDSLTRVFRTRAGREVRDGGGVKPDVLASPDSLPSFIYDLVASEEMFDYVTRYARRHSRIAPAADFGVTDEEYADFARYMQESGFVANRRSESVMKLLKEAARLEGYYEPARAEFEALEARLNNDLQTDLLRLREDVKPYLNAEIVSRYYYQRGTCQQQLKSDKVFDQAAALLANRAEYDKILRP